MFLIIPTLGLIMLLGGMYILRDGLQSFAGKGLHQTLLWMTATPGRGFFSGTVATALVQSSTALSVAAVSFVDAELLPFQNALALIVGSNIGSTVTNQLLAFPLERFALIAMLSGAFGYLFLPSRWRYLALSLSGLGTLFLALAFLESGLAPLAESSQVQAFLHNLGDHHVQGVIAGTLLSALLHSSSATAGIVMVLAQEGWITMPTALAFIFGANIGTCFTAVLAALATSRSAQRVALFHVLLNVFGVLLFYPFLTPMSGMLAALGGSLARQVANAHTLFNVISSLLALPLLPAAAQLMVRLLPDA